MRRHARSVLLVFVAGLVLTLAPTADAAAPTGTFTALSYNVAGLPEQLSGSEPATNSPLISPLLNDYDLVLLQENWADPLADQRQAGLVPAEVPRVGYHDLVVQSARHPFQSEPADNPYGLDPARLPNGPAMLADGLNRLSDFPFGELVRVAWERCDGELYGAVLEEAFGQSGLDDAVSGTPLGVLNDVADGGSADCGAQKGFSVARTELAPGVVVDVYNLHADAGGSGEGPETRRHNFRQLAAFIAEHSAGHAVIVGGDTNLHTDDPERPQAAATWSDFLTTTGLSDVCDAVDCGADAGEIDKFAFRAGDGVNVVPQTHAFERDVFVRDDGEPLSDHDALAVTFRWVATGR